MRSFRAILALSLLFFYLSGVVLQAAHALLAHTEPHPICTAKNEQHLHGEEYHFDLCNLCVFFVGNQTLETSENHCCPLPILLSEKIVSQKNEPLAAAAAFHFFRRGPPC